MTIERVGLPDPVSKYDKATKPQRATKKESKDSISFSADAKAKAEIYNATENVKMSPDIRMDRVEEVKRKLQDPTYISDKLIEEVAEKLMEHFNI
jgi:negative regulator of flagellin synthesis FlgM